MKRLLPLLLCLILLIGFFPATAQAAPEWPGGVSIQAEGGIVIDADSGTVLWGQNIHNAYYPASITKVMTALIVLESCNLDDIVTFSHNAVYNVEENSSNASISEGDQLTVRECLYALLLKSANEAANALAEFTAGSNETFTEMMNNKAEELGCTDSHFANPHGLNDEDNYTSAYDMALIAKEAFKNPVFTDIVSTTYHELTPTKIEPDGLGISPGHKMLKKNSGFYYPGIIGGKTGYTTLAGNTLVTCAERDGMKLITVILKGSQPQYYRDTKALLDFGFSNFYTLKAADYDTAYFSVNNDMVIGGLPMDRPDALVLDSESKLTLPKNSVFEDAVPELTYELDSSDPKDAVAKIQYTYNGRKVGCTYLKINQYRNDSRASTAALLPETSLPETSDPESKEELTVSPLIESEPETVTKTAETDVDGSLKIPSFIWIGFTVLIVITGLVGGIFTIKAYLTRKEEKESLLRKERRLKRLRDAGYSPEEFNLLLEQRRSSSYTARKKGRRRSHLKFK